MKSAGVTTVAILFAWTVSVGVHCQPKEDLKPVKICNERIPGSGDMICVLHEKCVRNGGNWLVNCVCTICVCGSHRVVRSTGVPSEYQEYCADKATIDFKPLPNTTVPPNNSAGSLIPQFFTFSLLYIVAKIIVASRK